MRTILEHTRPRSLYLVNPRREAIEGISCQASVRDIGAPVDLAIISVPAPAVPGCLADCASSGVTTAYVISAGFAETRAAEGHALDGQVRHLLTASEMRLGGPNGEGAFDLWSDFAPPAWATSPSSRRAGA
jgi:acetyltransferase